METMRLAMFSHHTLVIDTLKDNQITSETKQFESAREMRDWMHDHKNDGYHKFWAQSVEVTDTEWISDENFQRMASEYVKLAEIRRRYG
jgi:hypothetical protein